ncbi:MAG: hypothetical protein Q8T03_13705 [Bacteroidota bacterium]|nr:hypothetical protein [Bacteroidota bacterium]
MKQILRNIIIVMSAAKALPSVNSRPECGKQKRFRYSLSTLRLPLFVSFWKFLFLRKVEGLDFSEFDKRRKNIAILDCNIETTTIITEPEIRQLFVD